MSTDYFRKPFRLREIFRNCGAYEPLNDDFRDADLLEGLNEEEADGRIECNEAFSKVLPHMYCACTTTSNTGELFFFQVILQDFDFRCLDNDAALRETFYAIRLIDSDNDDLPMKSVIMKDGTEKKIPVLLAYVFTNRHRFPGRDSVTAEDDVIWRESIVERTKGVAHEILIAHDWHKNVIIEMGGDEEGTPTRLGETLLPLPPNENDLVCSYRTMEKFLTMTEQHMDGIKLTRFRDFEKNSRSVAVQKHYYDQWLLRYTADRNLVYGQTDRYYDDIGKRDKVDRSTPHEDQGVRYRNYIDYLVQQNDWGNKPVTDKSSYRYHLKYQTRYLVEYYKLFRKRVCKHGNDEYINYVTERALT